MWVHRTCGETTEIKKHMPTPKDFTALCGEQASGSTSSFGYHKTRGVATLALFAAAAPTCVCAAAPPPFGQSDGTVAYSADGTDGTDQSVGFGKRCAPECKASPRWPHVHACTRARAVCFARWGTPITDTGCMVTATLLWGAAVYRPWQTQDPPLPTSTKLWGCFTATSCVCTCVSALLGRGRALLEVVDADRPEESDV